MTPEQLEQFNKMDRTITELTRRFDALNTEPEYDPAVAETLARVVSKRIRLTDLLDVNTGATNNQVIKWNSTTEEWDPANDIDT